MKLKRTSKLKCLTLTIAIFSTLSSLIGLALTGISAWLWTRYCGSLNLPVWSYWVSLCLIGFMTYGPVMLVMNLFGITSALLWNRCGLIVYNMFCLASVGVLAGIWTYIFFGLQTVPAALRNTFYRFGYYQRFAREFICSRVQSASTVEQCITVVNRLLHDIMWIMFGPSAGLFCLQSVLLIMVAALFSLIIVERKRTMQVIPHLQRATPQLCHQGSESAKDSNVQEHVHTDVNLNSQAELSDFPTPSAPAQEISTTEDSIPPDSPLTQGSNKPTTSVQVNANVDVTANIVLNPLDLQQMIQGSQHAATPQPDYEPSPGLPPTIEDPLLYPQLPSPGVPDAEVPVTTHDGEELETQSSMRHVQEPESGASTTKKTFRVGI